MKDEKLAEELGESLHWVRGYVDFRKMTSRRYKHKISEKAGICFTKILLKTVKVWIRWLLHKLQS